MIYVVILCEGVIQTATVHPSRGGGVLVPLTLTVLPTEGVSHVTILRQVDFSRRQIATANIIYNTVA